MIKYLKLLLNTISFIAVLLVNYFSNTGIIAENTVGEISRKYETVITPAGYAFSIWGLIYLLLLFFILYQWYTLIIEKSEELLNSMGYWFFISNLANASWVILWTMDAIGLSVILMVILLFSLIQLIIRLNMENFNPPFKIIFFVWWPLSIYFGWIVLATVLNITVFFVSLGWAGGFLAPQLWAILIIGISTVIYLLLVYTRNLREASIVGAWGMAAIAVRQWDFNPEVAIAALISAAALIAYVAFHAYKNRRHNPLNIMKSR